MHIMVTAKQRQTSKTLAFGALMVVVAQHVVPVGEVAWFVKWATTHETRAYNIDCDVELIVWSEVLSKACISAAIIHTL